MAKLSLAQLTVASNFIFSSGVFGAQLYTIRNVDGVRNHLACHEYFKPECGDYIQPRNHLCNTQISDRFCQMPSTSDGDNGKQMDCVSKKCIVKGSRRCDRSRKSSSTCKQRAGAAGSITIGVNFLIGNQITPTRYTDASCAGNIDCFPVASFRISCQSDRYVAGANYGGAIIYDAGGMPGILPGYTILARIDAASKAAYRRAAGSTEGMVHGQTLYKRFRKNPSALYRQYPKLKIAGFAYYKGKIQFSSGTFNGVNWKLQQQMVEDERVIVTALLDAWKKNGIAATYSPTRLAPYVCGALCGTTSLPTSAPISRNTAVAYSTTNWPQCRNTVLSKSQWP